MNKPIVHFNMFVRELKEDLRQLSREYPPGPTVYDIEQYYGESRFRSEKAVQFLEERGIVGRVCGAGRKIHIIGANELEARRHDTGRLTPIQSRVISELVLLADAQGTKEKVRFTIGKLSLSARCSTGAVQQALRRAEFFGLIENIVKPVEKGPFESILDLKIAS